MFGDYFYNGTTKKVISVFGSMFNNIYVTRKEGDKTTNTMRVPISYGPKKKFLARIEEGESGVAIKLPRMSFEITSLGYDSTAKLNRLNRVVYTGTKEAGVTSSWQNVPYDVSLSLSIYGNTQDDVLQVLEQILPTFTPEYTVTIKGLEGEGTLTDVPFTLNGISLEDSYEGDFNTRRTIIYTLDFTAKIKYAGPQTPVNRILEVVTNFRIPEEMDELDDVEIAETITVLEDESVLIT